MIVSSFPHLNGHTKEQKQQMLGVLLNTPGGMIQDVAKQLGIPEGTLRGWYNKHKREAAVAPELDIPAPPFPPNMDPNAANKRKVPFLVLQQKISSTR